MPIFFNNQHFAFNEYEELIKLYGKNTLDVGFLIYLPLFNTLSFSKIKEIKTEFEKYKISDYKTVLFGNGHPSKQILYS